MDMIHRDPPSSFFHQLQSVETAYAAYLQAALSALVQVVRQVVAAIIAFQPVASNPFPVSTVVAVGWLSLCDEVVLIPQRARALFRILPLNTADVAKLITASAAMRS